MRQSSSDIADSYFIKNGWLWYKQKVKQRVKNIKSVEEGVHNYCNRTCEFQIEQFRDKKINIFYE